MPSTLSPEAAREQRIAEAKAAYDKGYAHVAACVAEFGTADERLLEMAFSRASEFDNPYQMVAYGDEGHERPEWSRGFNHALAEHYGVKLVVMGELDDDWRGVLNGWDMGTGTRMTSYADAERCAEGLSKLTGAPFIAEDRGGHVSPRYAVIRAFQIGEPVSYGFNGDSYPCGRIVGMSGKGGNRIITTRDHNGKERKFWRRDLSGSWKHDGMWSLMHGWHRDRNPSF
jgi:hypothetical protein